MHYAQQYHYLCPPSKGEESLLFFKTPMAAEPPSAAGHRCFKKGPFNLDTQQVTRKGTVK